MEHQRLGVYQRWSTNVWVSTNGGAPTFRSLPTMEHQRLGLYQRWSSTLLNFFTNELLGELLLTTTSLLSKAMLKHQCLGLHQQSFLKSYWIKQKSYCIYHFPIDLEQNGHSEASTLGSPALDGWLHLSKYCMNALDLRKLYRGAFPYSNNRSRWQDLTLESSADILQNASYPGYDQTY